ncbi:hypothetical protein HYU14_02635 [Candidatus Woesearchaeota archaeon]|nr:hypothetical protein [Candidatus Woesearchaeota archaeon]
MKDWLSGGAGTLIFLLGLLPILNRVGIGPGWFDFSLPVALLSWVIALGGFYLAINSIIEVTNSNVIGWPSFITAAAVTSIGVMQVLGQFGVVSGFLAMGWISGIFFNIIFVVMGLFLMIATFAMEL